MPALWKLLTTIALTTSSCNAMSNHHKLANVSTQLLYEGYIVSSCWEGAHSLTAPGEASNTASMLLAGRVA